MLKSLYHKVLALAKHPNAKIWLGVISFIESSFFPIPADILFIPMALADRKNALKLATLATVTSVLGGIFGYYIGFYGYETIAKPMLEALGKSENFEYYRQLMAQDVFLLWGLLLSSGLTHIPPIKMVTILSGVAHVPLSIFIISAIIGRGLRFYLLGWLIYKYGESIQNFIETRLNKIFIIGVIVFIGLYVGLKYLSIASFF